MRTAPRRDEFRRQEGHRDDQHGGFQPHADQGGGLLLQHHRLHRAGPHLRHHQGDLGLERHLHGVGIELVRTPVGDRYVLEQMRAKGYNVGGEQSGHIIFSDFITTGDGLIGALQVLAVLAEEQMITMVVVEQSPMVILNG